MKMAKGKDLVSKDKVFDDKFKLLKSDSGYVITSDGVNLLLEDYWSILEMGTYSYDPSVIFIRADFERALRSSHLSPIGRLSLALVYGMQLSLQQASKLIGIKVSDVKNEIEEAKEVMEAVMNGYLSTIYQKKTSETTNLTDWIQEIMKGSISIYDIPDEVFTSLLHYLAENRDKLAKETLRQKREGMPIDIYNEKFGIAEYDSENYPFYDTAETIENPFRFREYRTGDIDYFKRHDRYYGVAFPKDFSKMSKGLTVTGRRTLINVKEEDKNSNGKGLVYNI